MEAGAVEAAAAVGGVEVEGEAVETALELEAEAEAGTEEAAVRAAAAPLASEEELRQAQAEGLTLRVGKNSTGYFGVCHEPIKSLPYRAQLMYICIYVAASD